MSFHGGLLGVMVAVSLFAWRRGRNVADVFDFTVPLPGLGLFFGRIGNFINGELWGKVDHGAVGLQGQRRSPPCLPALRGVFRRAGAVHHPLVVHRRKPRPSLAPSGLFLLVYGVVRFMIEFVRVPDEHIGYLAGGWLTEGQVLSIPDDSRGLALLAYAYRARSAPETSSPRNEGLPRLDAPDPRHRHSQG